MKKKIIASVCAALMLVSSLAGCGSKSSKTVGDKNQINLRFSFWEPSTGKETETALQKVVDSYKIDHPNINIELVAQSPSGYQDWIKAQMAVNDLPEIQMNGAGQLIEMGKNGVVENIGEAFDSPNPYNENKIWKDTFVDGALDGAHEYRVANEYNIPLFGTGVAMFYNKEIYNELGLSIPKDWNEFIANCEVIKNAGKVPIAWMGQKKDQLSWLFYELSGDLYMEKFMDNAKLNYNGDNYISKNEQVKAILNGDFNIANDKELQADFKLLCEYIQKHLAYAPNGSGFDEAAAKTLFLSGKAAHLTTGSWDIVGLLFNDEVDIDVGVFKYPKLTKENSEYAIGRGISNNCYQAIAISSTVKKQEGAREAAVDFLMYLTSPEQYSVFIDGVKSIPTVKDVKVDDIYNAFMEEGGYPYIQIFRSGDENVGVSPWNVLENVAAGKDVKLNDKLFADIQKSLESWAETEAERNKITKENDYLIDTLPLVGGKRK